VLGAAAAAVAVAAGRVPAVLAAAVAFFSQPKNRNEAAATSARTANVFFIAVQFSFMDSNNKLIIQVKNQSVKKNFHNFSIK
jgi:hypothetical protein